MITRFYLKEHLSFKEVALEFDQNFIIFTGPSGAGKSILMEALLSLFGIKECDAKMIEASIERNLNLIEVGIEEDHPNIFKLIKSKSTRYFINNQQISKKNIKIISKSVVNYLTLREFTEFENENLLTLLDAIASKDNKKHQQLYEKYQQTYHRFLEATKALQKITQEEKKVEELKEFTQFEIQKIETISPNVDEYETLMIQKKELSKKEKIETALSQAQEIFTYRTKVNEALNLLNIESTFFDDALNELESIFSDASSRLDELDDLDIESLLNRIEKLSELKRKHGSIQEALIYLEKKKEELIHYENLKFEKEKLQEKQNILDQEVHNLAEKLSQNRQKALKTLQNRVEHYLNLLYLQDIHFTQNHSELSSMGQDSISVSLKQTKLTKVSAGELNRLRLALLAASSEFIQSDGGILILDEIDANLSGKESMSIASVLQVLCKSYQIFAISHQPQLSSCAQMHFLVHKTKDESSVTLLDEEGRIKELSRMISGEEITQEAIQFAKSLREDKS